MSSSRFSRRAFLRTAAAGGAGVIAGPLITARGREAAASPVRRRSSHIPAAGTIRLDSNENPNGPAPAALDAIRATLAEAGRYNFDPERALLDGITELHQISPANVLLGCGSTELLRVAVETFVTRERGLVTALPTFESARFHAERLHAPVDAIPVDGALRLDLRAMAARASSSGLVYICNPNNPTGTVHPAGALADFVRLVRRSAPAATILIDEAYHEYVDDPRHATAVPLALESPRVVVLRTFSKVYGLAGLRVGYAIAATRTIDEMAPHLLAFNVNILAAAAAGASLPLTRHVERERAANAAVREFTHQALAELGCVVTPSQTNFVMADVRRDARTFQDACRERGVLVGRPIPPLRTHSRISFGTMDEMRRALDAIRGALRR